MNHNRSRILPITLCLSLRRSTLKYSSREDIVFCYVLHNKCVDYVYDNSYRDFQLSPSVHLSMSACN